MDFENYYLGRVERPIFFTAPQDLIAHCVDCGLAIQPGQIIVQLSGVDGDGDETFAHECCVHEEEN